MTSTPADLDPREPVDATLGPPKPLPRHTLGRLMHDWRALSSIVVLTVVLIMAVGGRWIRPFSPSAVDGNALLEGPSSRHWFGTDELGRDLLSRVISAAPTTVEVVIIAVPIGLIVGAIIGLLSGYAGGWVDAVIMRIVDAMMAFPGLVLALAIVAALGTGLTNALVAISIINMPRTARLVRGETLSLRTRDYVASARIVGVPTRVTIARHLLPHMAGTLLVFTAVQASTSIVAEASLAFLGLSSQPPDASWGAMVASGVDRLNSNWAISVFPGLAILFTVAALNLLADALGHHIGTTTTAAAPTP